MKKLLLITVALLALGAATAVAQDGSINLTVGSQCRTGPGTAAQNDIPNNIGGVPCDDAIDPFAGAHRFATVAFTNTQTLTNFAGCAVLVEVITGQPGETVRSNFWSMGNPEGVNSGAMAVRGTVPTTVANCNNPYTGDAQTIIGDIHQRFDVNNANRIRITYRGSRVRSNTQVALGAPSLAGGWVADQMDIDMTNAAVPGFEGCQQVVGLVLNGVQYGGGGQTFNATTPGFKSGVTFAGGPTDFPGATPTHNSTWGQVKALYR